MNFKLTPIENALLNALSNPDKLSGNYSSDGKSLTNFEYYKNIWKKYN